MKRSLWLIEVKSASVDVDFFVDAGVSMLLPLCHLSRRRVGGLPAEVSQILNTQIQARTIMTLESRLWLEAIHRRLAGRLRERNHFKVKLSETSPTSFSRVTKSKKVYRGICAVIRVL